MLEKILRVPWIARKSNQSIPKEINAEYSLEGQMLKLKLQYFPDVKNWLIWKDPDAGKDWGQEERGATEDDMVGWHHRLDRYEFEQTQEDGEVQGSLACCSSWGHKELTWLSNQTITTTAFSAKPLNTTSHSPFTQDEESAMEILLEWKI